MRLERVAQSSVRAKRGKEKKKEKARGELDPPYEGPRPLVTFPILLGTPLPGQSRRPRGTPHPPLQPLTFQLFSSSRTPLPFSTRVKARPSIFCAMILPPPGSWLLLSSFPSSCPSRGSPRGFFCGIAMLALRSFPVLFLFRVGSRSRSKSLRI